MSDRTIWSSPASKRRLGKKLASMLPAHKVYVEPMAGAAPVFFAKAASDLEVLGDSDPEVGFAYDAIKNLTDGELAALKGKDWTAKRDTYYALSRAQPAEKVDRLHKFLYTGHFGFAKSRLRGFDPYAEGRTAKAALSRVDSGRARLKSAIIRSGDYTNTIAEFDGAASMFYFDPPNPRTGFDQAGLRKALEGMRGRFLMTCSPRTKLDLSGFFVKMLRPDRSLGSETTRTPARLVVANFALGDAVRKDQGFDLVDVGEMQGSPVDAMAIARTRALAFALVDAYSDLVEEMSEDDVGGDMLPLILASCSGWLEVAAALGPMDDLDLPVGDSAVGDLLTDALLDSLGDLPPDLLDMIGPMVARALPPTPEPTHKALWTTAYVNDLPDSAFLFVEPGEKDADGKTTPRSLRHFPVRDSAGKVDMPHARAAVARLPQSTVAGLSADKKKELQDAARKLLASTTQKTDGPAVPSLNDRMQAVSDALRLKYPPPSPYSNTPYRGAYPVDVWDNFAVYEYDSKILRISYVYENGAVRFTSDPEEVKRTYVAVKSDPAIAPPKGRTVAFLRKSEEERTVTGIVLEPDVVDSQGDTYDAATIRVAEHVYMAEYQNRGLMHADLVNDRVQIVESYLAPVDMVVDGRTIKAGTWMMTMKILDDAIWADVKAGRLAGYSIGGSAIRKPIAAPAEASAAA